MQHHLTWHGHANFQIESAGLTILIDPFFDGNPSCRKRAVDITKADLVLVTHDHGDHTGQTLDICLNTGAKLGAVVETAQSLTTMGLPESQVLNGIGFNIGGTLQHRGLKITMTQATHTSATGVPVGYILELADGFTIYHAGDTGLFAGMELLGRLYAIDLAMLPIGGTFTMGPRQAAMACDLLNCTQVVPMHWGTFPVLEQTTETFAAKLESLGTATKLLAMAPGQTVILEKE